MLGIQQLLPLLSPRQAALVQVATETLKAFGSHLSTTDQVWLSSHLQDIPEFFKSPDGSELANMLVDAMRAKISASKPLPHIAEVQLLDQ